MANAHANASNKNVELGGRDTFKKFKHGISGYTLGERRVDGGWHIAMSHQLCIAPCTRPELLSKTTRLQIAEAYELLFAVHHALRNPLPRELVHSYDLTTSQLLDEMVQICAPSTKSQCCSMKFHWPRHWAETCLQLGCAAEEKTLERNLGQSPKRNFRFTNRQEDTCEVGQFNLDVHQNFKF
jgi:hypothetical protein